MKYPPPTTEHSHVKQELPTIPEHASLPAVFSEVRIDRSVVFCVVFCRLLFVLLFYFLWPLYCLSFIDLQLLISSHFSSVKAGDLACIYYR